MNEFNIIQLLLFIMVVLTLINGLVYFKKLIKLQEENNELQSIYVENGTYYENIIWPALGNIQLIGEDRDSTIVNGNDTGIVIDMTSLNGIEDFGTLISHLTITNGYTSGDNGGGLRISGSPTLQYLNIVGNHAFTASQIEDKLTISTPTFWSFFTSSDRYTPAKMASSLQALYKFYHQQRLPKTPMRLF